MKKYLREIFEHGLKLNDEHDFSDLHPSGVLLERARLRKGISLQMLAKVSGYNKSGVSRLRRRYDGGLERGSVDLIAGVLRAMVILKGYTSMDEIDEYLDALPKGSV